MLRTDIIDLLLILYEALTLLVNVGLDGVFALLFKLRISKPDSQPSLNRGRKHPISEFLPAVHRYGAEFLLRQQQPYFNAIRIVAAVLIESDPLSFIPERQPIIDRIVNSTSRTINSPRNTLRKPCRPCWVKIAIRSSRKIWPLYVCNIWLFLPFAFAFACVRKSPKLRYGCWIASLCTICHPVPIRGAFLFSETCIFGLNYSLQFVSFGRNRKRCHRCKSFTLIAI